MQVIENPNFYGTTDASGNYSFNISAGSYTITASSWSYFSQTTNGYQSVPAGATTVVPFSLVKMGSYNVTTDVYLLNEINISQVVASTGPTGDEEYIELYNPTSASVSMGNGSCCGGAYWANYNSDFYYYDNNGQVRYTYMTYVTTAIPPKGFYLIANNPTIHAGGVTRTADAYYGPPGLTYLNWVSGFNFSAPNHMIVPDEFGGILLWRRNPGWYVADSIGWKKGAAVPLGIGCEGGMAHCVPTAAGLAAGDQLIRFSTPGGVVAALGPAYDSDINDRDFAYLTSLPVGPSDSSVTKNPVAGYPAAGSWVNLTDSLSLPGLCVNTLVSGLYPVCRYTTAAATGTWTAISYSLGSASANYYKEFDNLVVSVSSVAFPNAATTPAWPAANYSSTLLSDTTNYAFVAGTVFNAVGVPLNAITVSGGGRSTSSAANGRYFLGLTAGAVDVTANPGNTSAPTLSQEMLSLATLPATLYDSQNFNLSQAGSFRGYYKTSSNVALPNRSAVVLRGVAEMGQGTSDSSGNFYVRNLDTGTYVVVPTVDPAESVSPSSVTISLVSAGSNVFIATFTVSNGLAQITGTTTAGGKPINTGVLIVVTTATLPGGVNTPAPSVSGANGCAPCYYESSSDSTGNYTLSLRSSAVPYNVYGYYTTFSGTTLTTTRAGPFSVTVASPLVTYTQPLAW